MAKMKQPGDKVEKNLSKTYIKDVPSGRAIAIRQPFVELILRGIKKYEYRSQLTHIRGRVFLYASKGKIHQEIWDELEMRKDSLPTGVIVGSVEIVECLYDKEYKCYKYKLSKPRRFRKHLEPVMSAQPRFFFPFGRHFNL